MRGGATETWISSLLIILSTYPSRSSHVKYPIGSLYVSPLVPSLSHPLHPSLPLPRSLSELGKVIHILVILLNRAPAQRRVADRLHRFKAVVILTPVLGRQFRHEALRFRSHAAP
jgi:hypothetical protein